MYSHDFIFCYNTYSVGLILPVLVGSGSKRPAPLKTDQYNSYLRRLLMHALNSPTHIKSMLTLVHVYRYNFAAGQAPPMPPYKIISEICLVDISSLLLKPSSMWMNHKVLAI